MCGRDWSSDVCSSDLSITNRERLVSLGGGGRGGGAPLIGGECSPETNLPLDPPHSNEDQCLKFPTSACAHRPQPLEGDSEAELRTPSHFPSITEQRGDRGKERVLDDDKPQVS